MEANELDSLLNWINERLGQTLGIELYVRQKDALKKLLQRLHNSGAIRGVIQMPTGAGKTVVAAGLIMALYRMKLLHEKDIIFYLTPRKILRGQVEDKFDNIFQTFKRMYPVEVYPMKERRVFNVQNLQKEVSERLRYYLTTWQGNEILILILTPQGFHGFIEEYWNADKLNNIWRIRMIIMDEIHRVYFGPEILKSIEKLLQAPSSVCTIGLSATPIKQAIKRIGPLLYRLSSLQAMKEGILVGRLKIYPMNTWTRLKEEIGRDEWEVAVIERAEKYSEKILEKLREELRTIYTGLSPEVDPLTIRIPKTLVVAASTTEADEIALNLRRLLSASIPNASVNELVRVAHYRVEDPVKEINEFRKQGQGILVTVNMADMGFDDPNLEVLVIARPMSTPIGYVQVRGRVLRKPKVSSDNLKAIKYAVLIDLTGASRHEKSVEKVELGEFELEDENKLKHDLEGAGEVQKVHGEVEIIEDKPFEISPEIVQKEREGTETGKLLEMTELLREGQIYDRLLGKGLNPRFIKSLLDFIFQWRRNANKEKLWSLEELMKRARIPKSRKMEVEKILAEILKEILGEKKETLGFLCSNIGMDPKEIVKVITEDLLDKLKIVLVISRGMKEYVTVRDLGEVLQRILKEGVDWVFVRYPIKFHKRVYSTIRKLEEIKRYWLTTDIVRNEWMAEIFLKKWW